MRKVYLHPTEPGGSSTGDDNMAGKEHSQSSSPGHGTGSPAESTGAPGQGTGNPGQSSHSPAAASAGAGKPGQTRSRRGFAGMDPARQREISSMGGKASHERGTGHEFTPQEAAAAGRKGGLASRKRNAPSNVGGSTNNR